MDDGITSKIPKLADEAKIASKVTTTNERETLQTDLDRLVSWASKRQMKFNFEKCIGSNINRAQYLMNGQQLSTVNKEMDLGIAISSD